ncbi:condensin complex subunit SMC1 [Gloeophyllum trabeum ATCC 11539]|uniref:Structural maintenance of chromosomes protein n=1 Tax=Gloeophyllum trabeum (strain ATCC 11539 / FP-39264 / Madison 617) TaxID=670483 RepID=S7R9G9_GLOTA|nr:condensin complex subunit SMC1 [Gloeophyllum trabeum ATCC 11539]EPQ50920.1 condensin complex subunit SMC1 [Gloeophyllum trabeum ATCC 11539]
MPLIRIEVCDFKSYRGHQTIGPFRNFTSVIGPNGAGKSNLMDAISFVLGVKSAQLRSSQLKDLVYRGRRLARGGVDGQDASYISQSGQDEEGDEEGEGEGTAKTAWVLAVFEDSAKKEWRFQRTISTTGASEYKLNGKVVTYAAYNAALQSHNILVKAKNFLVFQGDVEAVASQSPKELTRLIEQISGSLELAGEYEKAKEAQERATENATFNFTKRRGIAGEIKQYKEQKSEADRFEAMCQERDQLLLHRILWRLFHIEEGLEQHAREINAQSRTLEGLREEQREHDEELDAARAEQAKARSNVMQKEKRIKKAEKGLEAKKPDLVAVEGQIAHSARKLRNAQNIREQVAKEEHKQQEKLTQLQKELAEVRKLADAAQEAQRRASQNNFSLSKESLQEYNRLKAEASILAVDERQALDTLGRELKTVKRTLAQVKDKYEQLEQKKEKLTEESKSQNSKKSELEERISSLQSDLSAAKQELDNQQSERTRISQLETELNEKLAEVYQKILQAGMDQRESEREMKLKEVLTGLQRIFPGVRGRVVDLCKPSARKYETAVSVILGRNIDAVVVDEEKTAIDCIEYMRNQRAGQATFIPLDTIQVKPVNDKFRSFASKGARLAIDVIEYEPAVERAIHHACGNALVCDTMDVARYVCYEKGQEVKAVTLEGTIIHKSGLITGGRSTHGTGKKWEEKDVQGLQRVRDSLLSQLRELAKNKPRGKTDDTLIAEITRLENALTVAKDDLSACKLRLNGIRDELKHVTQELKKTTPELNKTQAQHDSLEEKIIELSFVVNAAEDGVFAVFCRQIGVSNIREYEERQLKLTQEELEARNRYETQIARLGHQSQFEEEQLKATRERLATLDATIRNEEVNLVRLEASKASILEELSEAESSIASLQEELQALNESLEEKTKVVDRVKRTASKATKALEQTLKEIASHNDEIEKLGLERSAIYRKCRLENVNLPLREGNLKNVPMEENLREEVAMDVDEEGGVERPKRVPDYGLEVDFEILDEDEREDGSADKGTELEDAISKLNEDIERMAPNLKAVDRLEDVESKLLETEKEADKSRKESKTARDQFNDVKKRRCELFNKAYNHISECIDQVYKDLTKGKAAPMGGVAYLSLEDSEEPYLGGVKYHAMPPMKRFRDMEQLSGGEKTVAALALLFAIHSYQPSPFFVLDEVDAALDNTNVAKVANYIRSHASDTFQFIVISLKGSLYERGHSLVGIYRDQDVNSSRTLTLDLTQYDD